MAKSSASVIASKSKMEARLVAAKAELAAAQSTEVFNNGQHYTVVIGAPGQKEEHQGLLLGQFENDKGVLKLRFQVGSGMDMRVLDLSTSAVKVEATPVYDAEGKEIKVRSSAVISSIIAKIERRLASFDADLADASLNRALRFLGALFFCFHYASSHIRWAKVSSIRRTRVLALPSLGRAWLPLGHAPSHRTPNIMGPCRVN